MTKIEAIDKNIADCHEMFEKCQKQVEGFKAMQPSPAMPQKKIDRRIAMFQREADKWELRLAKWEARRREIVGE